MADAAAAVMNDATASQKQQPSSSSSLVPSLQDISLFATITESQSSHGILHQDYAQYHRYCTNRLDRLRHHKEARTHLSNNPKYISASEAAAIARTTTVNETGTTKKPAVTVKQRRHGYGARAPPPSPGDVPALADDGDALDIDTNQNNSAWQTLYAYTLLYQAERCWAQACAMQHSSAAATAGSTGNKQQQQQQQGSYNHAHCLRRLHKAAKWSQRLCDWMDKESTTMDYSAGSTSASSSSSMTALRRECESYAQWMQANAALEQNNYAAALHAYQESMTILWQLAATANDAAAPDAIVVADVWNTRAESVLRPLVRYCAYQAKVVLTEPDGSARGDVASIASNTADGAAGTTIVISFAGKDVALDSYKQLVVLYLKLEDTLTRLFGTSGADKDDVGDDNAKDFDDDQFLQLSCDLDDMLDQVKTEQTYYASLPTGPAVTAKRGDLETLLAYFQFLKLQVWRLQQERRLESLTDDVELVHAYDILQQNVQAMLELLPAANSDQHEDDPSWLETQAHVLRIRAFRCYYLARLYESTLDGTPQQCLALLAQASKLLKRAQEEIEACEDTMKQADIYLLGLEELEKQVKVMICRVEATQYLEQESIRYGHKTNRPLWLRLDDLDAGKVLCDNPPLPIVMPCKPVFFDIAYQHVGAGDFPIAEIEDFIDANEPKKGGFFSWFRSSK